MAELHPFRPIEIRSLSDLCKGTSPDLLLLDHANGIFIRLSLDGAESVGNELLRLAKALREGKTDG